MKPTLKERIEETEKTIEKYFDRSKTTMLQKNHDRGDCWRNSGLLGQFIEMHSMYFRLRRLIYEMGYPKRVIEPVPKDGFYNLGDSLNWSNYQYDLPAWKGQVTNALEDLRNFTMLAEMCLEEDNWDGSKYTNENLEEG